MRYHVQFRIREDTGEVELFQVDTVDADPRAEGHDAAHDRVAAELAGVLENDAVIDELPSASTARLPAARTHHKEQEEERQLPRETHNG
jgi:hypothetical protein